MAKPDCDDGWMKLARELFAAFCLAPFTDGEKIVLLEVFEQIYGPAKSRRARFSVSALARAVGVHRSHVSDGLHSLLKAGVLVGSVESGYTFKKDYESWKRRGLSLLSESRAAHAKSAPKRAKLSRVPDTNGCHPLTPTGVTLTPTGVTDRHQRVSPPDTNGCHPHIEERARVESKSESKSESTSSSSSLLSSAKLRAREKVGKIDDDDDLSQTYKYIESLEGREQEIARLAETVIPARGAAKFFLANPEWPLDWVERALESARKWRDPPKTVKPVAQLLNEWLAQHCSPDEGWHDWREKGRRTR